MDDVARWFAKGSAAHEAGKFAEAADLFSKVWAVKKAWDVAANLGLAEVNLGRHVAAAEHLSYALRWFPASEATATRAVLERRLAAARAEVGALKLTVDSGGADVRVGGEKKGTTPLENEVFVASGTVTIEVKKDGYETVAQTIEVKKGDTRELSVALVAKPTPSPERSMVPPAIAFGMGGAGLIMGAVAGGIAAGQRDELRKKCGQGLECPESARAEADTAKTTSRVATAGFIVAGLGAAVGVTLLLIPSGKKAPPRAALLLGPAFVGVKGVF